MKKIRRTLILLTALLTLFGGFLAPLTGNTTSAQAATSKIKVTYTLKQDKKLIAKKRISISKNAKVLTGLKKGWPVKSSKQGFITAIDGHKQNTTQKKYWTYTINGKSATKGAADQKLKANDKVVFTLSKS